MWKIRFITETVFHNKQSLLDMASLSISLPTLNRTDLQSAKLRAFLISADSPIIERETESFTPTSEFKKSSGSEWLPSHSKLFPTTFSNRNFRKPLNMLTVY